MDGEFLRAHDALAAHLRGLCASLPQKPAAIVIVSAHWDESIPTINAAAAPPMLYDYSGFPDRAYRFVYAAPGSAPIAERVRALLEGAGIAHAIETERGYDHGVFVPLMVAFPDADVPVVQLSLRSDMDARAHIALGRALAPLRDEGILIAGSGMTFHNMRAFRRADPAALEAGRTFDAWLARTMSAQSRERLSALEEWYAAPGARVAHPTPEHFVPLLVVAGAGGDDPAAQSFAGDLFGYPVSGWTFTPALRSAPALA